MLTPLFSPKRSQQKLVFGRSSCPFQRDPQAVSRKWATLFCSIPLLQKSIISGLQSFNDLGGRLWTSFTYANWQTNVHAYAQDPEISDLTKM